MNKVLLIGRLTKDLDLRKTASGTSYARFTLAVNRRFKTANDTQEADFISCVVWDKRAEIMYQYLGKGSQVGIEGRIQTGSYEGTDGKRVYTTDVIVDNFDFLETKGQKSSSQASYQPEPSGFQPDQDHSNFEAEPILDIASDDLPF